MAPSTHKLKMATSTSVSAIANPSVTDQKLSKFAKDLTPAIAVNNTTELSKLFRSDLASLRGLATCSICDQLLYEPWTLACGHTYCYSCLCNWFVPNRRKKTCPDCRAVVKQVPAPAFMVKQMVEVFMKRIELMPSDETIEQHQKKRLEEVEEADRDRRDNNLFKGTFPARSGTLMHDEADGVLRCPGCGHEHLGGPNCEWCDFELDDEGYGFSDMESEDIEDLELDMDEDYEAASDFGIQEPNFPHRVRYGEEESDLRSRYSSEGDHSDEDEDTSLQISEHDDQTRADGVHYTNVGHPSNIVTLSDAELDEDYTEPVGRRRQLSRSGPIVVDSEVDESDHHNDHADRLRYQGWSSLKQEDDSDNDVVVRPSADRSRQRYRRELETDSESDTETMIGNRLSNDENGSNRASRSPTPQYYNIDEPATYASDDGDDESEIGHSSVMDHEGDTEMSISPSTSRSSRSPSLGVPDHRYDAASTASRSSCRPSLEYRYGCDGQGEDLGQANEFHEPEEADEDDPDLSARYSGPRLRRRQSYHPSAPVHSLQYYEAVSQRADQLFRLYFNNQYGRAEPNRLSSYRQRNPRRNNLHRNARSFSADRVLGGVSQNPVSQTYTSRLPRCPAAAHRNRQSAVTYQ